MSLEKTTIESKQTLGNNKMSRLDFIYYLQLLKSQHENSQTFIQNVLIECMDLSHLDLSNITFLGCEISYCKITHCMMKNTNFINCELRGNDYRYTDLTECNMFSTMTKFVVKKSIEEAYLEERDQVNLVENEEPLTENSSIYAASSAEPPCVINTSKPETAHLRASR